MLIRFYFDNIEELNINQIIIEDISGSIKEKMLLNRREAIWYADIDGNIKIYTYRFVINNNIYINDYNADAYKLIDGQLWSVRYRDKDSRNSEYSKGYTKYVKSIVANQVNNDLSLIMKHNEFPLHSEKRVTIGVECNVLNGIHDICVIWICSNGTQTYTSYGVIQPEKEDQEYKVLIWFQLLLDKVDLQILKGEWKAAIILDGKRVKNEYFIVY